MAFAITQTCCNDASCVAVCPVNCIHPTPDEPEFGTTEMLYVDPATCIDCGACADACPVDAIFPVDALTESMKPYAQINADYFAGRATESTPADHSPIFHDWAPPSFTRTIPGDFPALDVAVVGTGPAGMYAVEDLLLHTSARVTLIDRLDTAGGLVRYGVAPDHPSTKKIGETFARFFEHPRLKLKLGVEIGRDVTVDELAAKHDAVIYAIGASAARSLGIPGEDLQGSLAATEVVAWYNGHPDVRPGAVDLSAERVVMIGTGNVALDVARILTADPSALDGTTISPEALSRLRTSKIREIVLLARRGPENAAYTSPEMLALLQRHDVDLVLDTSDPRAAETVDAAEDGKAALLKGIRREAVDWSAPPEHERRRIVLKFHATPGEILGDGQVRAIRLTDGTEIAAGQVIRAVGYHGTPTRGLPFDESTGTIPNTAGRVEGMPGTYVVGWIKRGPSGGIGANKSCASETVGTLLADVISGALPPRRKRKSLLRRRS